MELVPAGYHFAPTPAELIRGYLNPWVLTRGHTAEFHHGIVCVADIYASDPDALTSRFRHAGHGGNWYFLCVARWKGGKAGTRMSRCVRGGGTWHGSSKRRPVGAAGDVAGHRQGFEYRDAGGRKTAWIMDEFVTSLEQATDGEGVRVICKVHRSPRAPTTPAEAEEETDYNTQVVVVGSTPMHALTEEEKAGSSKRPRLLLHEEEHGLAACSAPLLPPDHEVRCYDYAGASHGAAVASTTWQKQSMVVVEQGAGCHGPSVVDGGVDDAGDGGEQEESAGGADRWLQRIDVGLDSTDADADADALPNEWTEFLSYGNTGGLEAGGGDPSSCQQ